MICTEEEARKKWCPKYQVAQRFNNLISNRGGFGDDCRCIASGCMMWEWETEQAFFDARDGSWKREGTERKGYCGLRGRP